MRVHLRFISRCYRLCFVHHCFLWTVNDVINATFCSSLISLACQGSTKTALVPKLNQNSLNSIYIPCISLVHILATLISVQAQTWRDFFRFLTVKDSQFVLHFVILLCLRCIQLFWTYSILRYCASKRCAVNTGRIRILKGKPCYFIVLVVLAS